MCFQQAPPQLCCRQHGSKASSQTHHLLADAVRLVHALDLGALRLHQPRSQLRVVRLQCRSLALSGLLVRQPRLQNIINIYRTGRGCSLGRVWGKNEGSSIWKGQTLRHAADVCYRSLSEVLCTGDPPQQHATAACCRRVLANQHQHAQGTTLWSLRDCASTSAPWTAAACPVYIAPWCTHHQQPCSLAAERCDVQLTPGEVPLQGAHIKLGDDERVRLARPVHLLLELFHRGMERLD